MKLKTYLAKAHINQADFARLINASRASVTRWVLGNRRPEIAQMREIERVTKGQVRVKDFYDTECDTQDWRCRVRAWARINGVELRAIAATIGVTQTQFARIMSGAVEPSLDIARLLINATDKKIKLEAFLGTDHNIVDVKAAGQGSASVHAKRSRVHAG
jgi:transcriptional regulator with XRE-family HTH domain